jgi:cytochrome c oxidase subunit II
MLINHHQDEFRERSGLAHKKALGGRGQSLRILGAILVAGCICASTARSDGPRRIEVTAKRFSFQPAEITVKKGETVDLALTSSDVTHGVRVRELNLDIRASKGKTSDVSFTPEKTGTFVGHCSVFCGSGHGQMTLTIHVVG